MRTQSLLLSAMVVIFNFAARAQDNGTKSFEIYGHIMTDAGYNFGQVHPDWFDVLRPSKISSFENEYGSDGNVYFSVRQTRLGVKSYTPTSKGELKTIFEFEMFGTGVDAGQTTFRLRHAYAELGKWGVGQYWSPFMDIDVFPNTLEYWGPNGMVFFRNVQIRYMPIQGETRLTIALERPGASADQGMYDGRIELDGVVPRFPLPDLSGEYRMAGDFGYVEIAGMLRSIKWEDQGGGPTDLSGSAIGWGLNLSSNLNFTKSTVGRFQVVYGQGIQNYMNDAPADIGVVANPGDPTKPLVGEALPILGLVAFVDQQWSSKFSSSLGFSSVDVSNTDSQTPDSFKNGRYAIGNLLYYPTENVLMGIEVQYGQRENFSDGWQQDIVKVQASFKYKFNQSFYRN